MARGRHPLFRSIRWRLVASYTLLTLLTVSLVGVLALSLVQRHLARQEVEYLAANAEAVAHQAGQLMWPSVRQGGLQQLARTATFLGNVQVRILDAQGQVLVNSGPPDQWDELAWLMESDDAGPEDPPEWPDTLFVMPFMRGPHRSGMRPWSQPEAYPDPQTLSPDTEVFFVRKFPSPWGIRLSFERGKIEQLLGTPPPEPQDTMLADAVDGYDLARSARVVVVPIGPEDDPLGYVELSNGPDFGAESLATIQQAFLVAAAGAALLAVIVGLLVARGLTAPLQGLTLAAGRMSGGDLSTRAPMRSDDEIGALARQFNRMAESLEANFADLARERDALRHFIADASHELRTPITALKTFNELLQDAAADDPAARAEFLAESQAQIDRLEWIIGNLLDLSRLDAGLVDLDVGEHDAGELLTRTAASFRPTAQERGIALTVVEPTPPMVLRCDGARIQLALSNLLDNALKFTPRGGQIQTGAEQAPGRVRLWVQDDGPGVEADDLPRIFERFYRGNNNGIRGIRGSGLGLAIVRSIVQAHGGQVTVESRPGAGSRFVIELPVSMPLITLPPPP